MTPTSRARDGAVRRGRWRTALLVTVAVAVAAVLDLAVLAADRSGDTASVPATTPDPAFDQAPATAAPPSGPPPGTAAPATAAAPATPPPDVPAATAPAPPSTPPVAADTVRADTAVQVLTYVVPGDAGRVVVAQGADGAELAGVEPAPGWAYEVERAEHDRIEVEFVNTATGEEREWELDIDDGGERRG